MSFLQEKQTRRYVYTLSGISILIVLYALLCNWNACQTAGKMIVQHDETVISGLIAEGVEQETIAASYRRMSVTEEGRDCVDRLGIESHNAFLYAPETMYSLKRMLGVNLLAGCLLAAALLVVSCLFLRKREQLYEKVSALVRQFAAGDFSSHLPGNEEGALYRLFWSIDELAMSQKSKVESERSTKEFLKNTISDISHQLKTPLAALHMYQEIITGEPENVTAVRNFSEKSLTALNRMERLIQLLLKVMRLDAGSILFAKEVCNVRELVLRSMEDLQQRAREEQKTLKISGSENSTMICDSLWTEEAVVNLVKNALDHTQEGGTIQIAWEETPAMVRLSVSDNGCGIPPEDLHHIFKRFYRGSKANDVPGIGLGLSLAKSIVEGQEGTLTVESEWGSGSTFTICLSRILTES